MIDPKDLRIGNLVSCEAIGDTYTDRKPYYGECIYAVTGLRGGFVWLDIGHDAEQKVPCDHVQRITITEEWLKRAGFIRRNRNLHKKGLLSILFITDVSGITHIRASIYQGIYGYNSINVEYVHQLQNLYFALTGEELQFEEI